MTIYDHYNELFKKLQIKNRENIINKLMYEDYELCKGLITCKNKKNEQIFEQYGGAKKIKYKFEGYTFVIYESESTNKISYHINNKSIEDTMEICVHIIVLKKEKYAYIQNVTSFDKCTLEGMPKSKGGSMLLRLCIQFLKELKDKYDLTYIQLKDNSFIFCNQNNTRIDFDSFYMLTHGDTWYGKYGFIPYDPEKEIVDIEKYSDYKLNQKLVNIIKVGCINMKPLIKRAVDKLKLHDPFNDKFIDKMMEKYKDRSVMIFMDDLAKTHDLTCGIINNIYIDVMKEIGMTNLHGSTYYLPL